MISHAGQIRAGFLLLALMSFEGRATEPTPGSLCGAAQTTYFSCQTARQRTISLCGTLPSALQYRYGKPGKVELAYPHDMAQGARQFAFAHYSRYQTDRVEVSFSHDDVDYTLFDYAEKGHRSAGVRAATSAERMAEIRCTGTVHGALAPMANSIRCDTDSALNGGQCP